FSGLSGKAGFLATLRCQAFGEAVGPRLKRRRVEQEVDRLDGSAGFCGGGEAGLCDNGSRVLLQGSDLPTAPHDENFPTDRALVERMVVGDTDALAAFYDRHSRLVYSTCLRVVRSAEVAE